MMHGSENVKSYEIYVCTDIHGVIPQKIRFFSNSRWESVGSDKQDQNFVQESAKVPQFNFHHFTHLVVKFVFPERNARKRFNTMYFYFPDTPEF